MPLRFAQHFGIVGNGMMNFTRLSTTAILLVTLAACGGATTTPMPTPTPPPDVTPEEEALAESTSEFEFLLFATSDAAAAGAAAMNAAPGNADFTGAAVVVVNPVASGSNLANADASLIGDATFNVNFGTGAISGSATDFYGTDGFSSTASVDDYTGTVNLSGGSIGDVDPNDVSVDYSGTLRGNDQVIGLNGTASGEFVGNPEITAVEMATTGAGSLDGANADVFVYIVAQPD